MKAGFYDALLETSAFIAPKNPLDIAIKNGFVRLVESANYGQSASKMWLKIEVPVTVPDVPDGLIFSSPEEKLDLEELKEWAYWSPCSESAGTERIPPNDRGETEVIKSLDVFLEHVEETKDDIKDAAKEALEVGKTLLTAASIISLALLGVSWLNRRK